MTRKHYDEDGPPIAWGGGLAPPVTPEPYPASPASPFAPEHASRGLPLEPLGYTPSDLVTGLALEPGPELEPVPEPGIRSCKLHDDCDAAEEAYRLAHPRHVVPGRFHRH